MKFIKKIITFIRIFYQKRKLRKQNKKQSMGSSFINPNATVINVGGETSVLDVDLVDDNVNDKDKKKVRQYTKSLVTALTVMACVWISSSYILATIALVMYGNAEPLSSLSEKVCEVIIGVVIAYSFKSYLESYSSAKHDLDVMKLETTMESINENNNDEPVG